MKFNFNSIWKYIAGGGTVLGYQAFYERLTNKSNAKVLQKDMELLQTKIDIMNQNITNFKGDEEKIKALENSIKEAEFHYANLLESYNACISKFNKITGGSGIKQVNPQDQSVLEAYRDKFQKAFDDCNRINENVDKAFTNLKEGSSKLMGDNYFGNFINDFNNYLSNLTLTEICLVINITSCMFILSCLVTIIFAFYGNLIISKFSLEKKYPKLAHIIKLRHTLQNTYIFANTSFIVVTSILMIIINFIALTN
nr:hypothetical protein [Cordyceps militaris]